VSGQVNIVLKEFNVVTERKEGADPFEEGTRLYLLAWSVE